MTTPIEQQLSGRPLSASPAKRDWCCGTPITAPHVHGCPYEPREPIAVEAETSPKPPAPDSQPESVPAASSAAPKKYGFRKAAEFDLELPSGDYVRVRKLRKMQVVDLKIMDMLDGFAPELLKDIQGGDPERASQAYDEAVRAVVDPETSGRVWGPINRVCAAAVICPTVVLDGPTTDDQVNVQEIEMDDKMAIFNAAMPDELKSAALGEQLAALKSVRDQSEAGLRDFRDGQAVQPETE